MLKIKKVHFVLVPSIYILLSNDHLALKLSFKGF